MSVPPPASLPNILVDGRVVTSDAGLTIRRACALCREAVQAPLNHFLDLPATDLGERYVEWRASYQFIVPGGHEAGRSIAVFKFGQRQRI